MKKTFFFLFTFMAFLVQSREQDLSQLSFQKANQAYENNEFGTAVESYKSLLTEGYNSEELHYNYANSLFKSNEIGLAILHYEKALKLNPSSSDAAYNLKLANDKTVDKIESIPDLFFYRWWRSIYNLFPADKWASILIGFFILALIGYSIFKLARTPKMKKVGFSVLSIGVLFAVLCWILGASQKNYALNTTHAIVLNSTIDILSAPSSGSSQLFVLHEGTKVKIENTTEGWLEISLPNGNQGWVLNNALAEI